MPHSLLLPLPRNETQICARGSFLDLPDGTDNTDDTLFHIPAFNAALAKPVDAIIEHGSVHSSVSGYDIRADFNAAGIVDIADFGLLVNNYNVSGDM